MCFKPCSVAIAFSSLRATSVSSWAGAAPGSDAVTLTVGRSMSGKFCTFIALKDRMPPKLSSTNSINAGTGLRIDQEETFSMTFSLPGADRTRRGRDRGRQRGRRGAVVQEAGPGGSDTRIGREPREDFQLVTGQPPGLHLELAHTVVRLDAEEV